MPSLLQKLLPPSGRGRELRLIGVGGEAEGCWWSAGDDDRCFWLHSVGNGGAGVLGQKSVVVGVCGKVLWWAEAGVLSFPFSAGIEEWLLGFIGERSGGRWVGLQGGGGE